MDGHGQREHGQRGHGRRGAVELVVLAMGLALLATGLVLWFGPAVALTVCGAVLVALGAWSAASDRGGGD